MYTVLFIELFATSCWRIFLVWNLALSLHPSFIRRILEPTPPPLILEKLSMHIEAISSFFPNKLTDKKLLWIRYILVWFGIWSIIRLWCRNRGDVIGYSCNCIDVSSPRSRASWTPSSTTSSRGSTPRPPANYTVLENQSAFFKANK